MKDVADILVEYQDKSRNLNYAGYNPLQCAMYDGHLDDTHALIQHYTHQRTLLSELSYVSPETNTRENILHVAMRHLQIFDLCCWAIEEIDTTLFSTLLHQADHINDTVFHQLAEFGRCRCLNILLRYLNRHVASQALVEIFMKKNIHGESAAEIIADYQNSKTIKSMKASNILSNQLVNTALHNCNTIQVTFDDEFLVGATI